MKKKLKLILFLLFLFLLANTINTTYSRYISTSTGDITTQIARWQISINNTNINQNYNTSITYTPVVEESDNVNDGKIAPGSTGYFDIEIDPTKVDVSFEYTVAISYENIQNDIPDLLITDYAIFDPEEVNPTINKISYSGSSLTNTLIYDNNTENFQFDKFVVRIYFVWDESTDQSMSNADDTVIGKKAANNETISNDYLISVHFKQYVGSTN